MGGNLGSFQIKTKQLLFDCNVQFIQRDLLPCGCAGSSLEVKIETDSNDAVEVKTEADGNDIAQYLPDVKRTAGMFPYSYVCS